jgi:hypothetical protein
VAVYLHGLSLLLFVSGSSSVILFVGGNNGDGETLS